MEAGAERLSSSSGGSVRFPPTDLESPIHSLAELTSELIRPPPGGRPGLPVDTLVRLLPPQRTNNLLLLLLIKLKL